MKFFQETTKWNVDCPNHIYLLSSDKSKAYGYIRAGTDDAFVFKKPYQFDTRGRTFVLAQGFDDIDSEDLAGTKSWQVAGSKGDVYTVEESENGLTCSCSGFRFRGDCRHIKEVSK